MAFDLSTANLHDEAYKDLISTLDKQSQLSKNLVRFIDKRGALRAIAVNAFDLLDAALIAGVVADLTALKNKIEDVKGRLNDFDVEVEDGMLNLSLWQRTDHVTEMQICSALSDRLASAIIKLDMKLSSLSASSPSNAGSLIQGQPPRQFQPDLSLPKIQLPRFDSNPLSYSRFIAQFNAIMTKSNYSEFQKYLILEQHIDGKAKSIVKTVGTYNMTYQEAVKALNKAFADTGKQKDAVIDQMLNLKLDPSDVYAWIRETSDLKEHVNTLDLKLNDVIRYFLWRSLSLDYQEKLIAICGSSRPNLAQILDNIYEAESRMALKHNLNVKHDKSIALAATMESSSSPPSSSSQPKKETRACSLCDNDHKMSLCPHYKTPEARLKRLKALKRCTKCSAEHESSSCKFKFRYPCGKCKEASHLTVLCVKAKKSGEQKSKANTSEKSSGSKPPEAPSQDSVAKVTLSLLSGNTPSDVVLPSFTASIESSSGNILRERAWLDCCSQDTLVDSDFARAAGLEKVKDLNLTISGFNSKKSFKTQKVKVPVWVGQQKRVVDAICVPKIDITLKLKGIGRVASKFKEKGYLLADEALGNSESVGGAKLLLGCDNLAVLPITCCSFGHENSSDRSVYMDTPLGILLGGKIPTLLENVEYLKDACQGSELQF